MTHVTVPFGEGDAVLKIQNTYLVPGQSVRFVTAAEGVSVEVTADGVTVSGDEQAPGGRRRLMYHRTSSGYGPYVPPITPPPCTAQCCSALYLDRRWSTSCSYSCCGGMYSG